RSCQRFLDCNPPTLPFFPCSLPPTLPFSPRSLLPALPFPRTPFSPPVSPTNAKSRICYGFPEQVRPGLFATLRQLLSPGLTDRPCELLFEGPPRRPFFRAAVGLSSKTPALRLARDDRALKPRYAWMMSVRYLESRDVETFPEAMSKVASRSRQMDIATAFLTMAGANQILQLKRQLVGPKRKQQVRVVVGTWLDVTEPAALT